VLGSSKATKFVACLAVFDPDTNSALSRQLEIKVFVLKASSACERLTYYRGISKTCRPPHNGVLHVYDINIQICASYGAPLSADSGYR
jgi:hypothetical protein